MDDKTIVEIATAKMRNKCLPENLRFDRQRFQDDKMSQSTNGLISTFGTWYCRKCNTWAEVELLTEPSEDMRILMWRKIHA